MKIWLVACCGLMLAGVGGAQVSSSSVWNVIGTENLGRLGASVTGLGDVNGDGVTDVAVGASDDASVVPQGGRVYVLSGTDGSLVYTVDPNTNGGRLGTGLAALDDLNGDGITEFAVGIPFVGGSGGRIRVCSGANGAQIYEIFPSVPNERLGSRLISVGDLNGDGVRDLVDASPFVNISPVSAAGRVKAFSGANGALLWTRSGSISSDLFGSDVAEIGDVNGDGMPEIAATRRPNDTTNLLTEILSGTNGNTLFTVGSPTATIIASGTAPGVGGPGDLNGDNVPDILVGQANEPSTPYGRVTAYSGADSSILWTQDSTTPFDFLGVRSFYNLGDRDGDGVNEILVPWFSMPDRLGAIDVVSGSDGRVLRRLRGPQSDCGFGDYKGSIGVLGDVTGDGRPEVVVGTPFYDVTTNGTQGGLFVYSLPDATYPGSGEDLFVATGVNGGSTQTPDVKTAMAGDLLEIRFDSRRAEPTSIPVLAAQFKMTGAPITQPMGFPEAWINPSPFEPFPVVALYDGGDPLFAPFGPGQLPANGFTYLATLPPGLSAFSIFIQGFVLEPSTQTGNPFFIATDAAEIQIL